MHIENGITLAGKSMVRCKTAEMHKQYIKKPQKPQIANNINSNVKVQL